jgi:hypothetical protein
MHPMTRHDVQPTAKRRDSAGFLADDAPAASLAAVTTDATRVLVQVHHKYIPGHSEVSRNSRADGRTGGTRDVDYELTDAPHQRLRETITPRASQNPKTLASRKHLAHLQLANFADAGPPVGWRGHHGQPAGGPEPAEPAVP